MNSGTSAGNWAIRIIAASLLTLLTAATGEVVYGPDARAEFEELRSRVGDSYLDFDGPEYSPGALTSTEVDGVTLTFKTTQKRYPSIMNVDYPVALRSASLTHNKTQSLMGAGNSSGGADGQSVYQIVFSDPQGRVGMMRNWNTASLTRFYNPDGVLLGEHKNTTADEFVGWKANGPEVDQWVSKVVLDGEYYNGAYQSGETDDLFFGTANPGEEPRDGLVYGPEAEAQFELFQTLLGDTLEDFERLTNGPVRTIEALNGVDVLTLKTTEKRYPKPPVTVDYPVCVLPFGGVTTGGTKELMGTSGPAGYADGQNQYEIVFSRVQHRAGIVRTWNTYALTRFYAEGGRLLAEHQNTGGGEFVGWVGDPDDESTWVKKIEMDGVLNDNVYQVGRSDDLRYGRAMPDRRRMEIVDFSLSPGRQVSISWQPAQMNHVLEFSYNLIDWQPADGVLNGDSWTGNIDGDPAQVYFRVLTEKLF
jgi:hypothetical protein